MTHGMSAEIFKLSGTAFGLALPIAGLLVLLETYDRISYHRTSSNSICFFCQQLVTTFFIITTTIR